MYPCTMRTSYFLIVFNLTAFLAGATSSSTQRQHHTISKRGAENAEYAIEIGMEAYGSIMISLGRRGDAEVSAERRRTLEAQLASLVDSNEIFHTPDKFRAALTRIAGRDHIALERLACAFRDESESDFARILVDAKEEIEKSTKLGELNRRLSANVVRLERRRDVINIGGVQGASTTAEFVRSIRRRCETVQEYIEGYQQSSRELRIYRLWLQEQLRTMERSVDREQDSISRYYDQWRQFFTAFTSGRTYCTLYHPLPPGY